MESSNNVSKNIGIKFARPVREDNEIKCKIGYNYIRTTMDEMPNANYINMEEPNKSDYAYETVKLLLLRKVSQKKYYNNNGKIFELINDIDDLMDDIYEKEESYADEQQLSNSDDDQFYQRGEKIINLINEIIKGDLYE